MKVLRVACGATPLGGKWYSVNVKRFLPVLAVMCLTACGAATTLPAPAPTIQVPPTTPGVRLAGAWTPDGACVATITQGASVTYHVTGATQATARAYTPRAAQYASTLAVQVDGGPWRVVPAPLADGPQVMTLASGLTPDMHTIRVVVSGVHETAPLWSGAAGVRWCGPDGDATQPAERGALLTMGDSIAAGIVVRGHAAAPDPASTPQQSAAELAYPLLVADALDLDSYPIAFGGTGITASGNGGVPAALAQFERLAPAVAPARVLLNYGANDAGRYAEPELVRAQYVTLVRRVQQRYPGVPVTLLGVVAGNRELNPVLRQVAVETGAGYIDAPAGTTVDGTHPDMAGQATTAQGITR